MLMSPSGIGVINIFQGSASVDAPSSTPSSARPYRPATFIQAFCTATMTRRSQRRRRHRLNPDVSLSAGAFAVQSGFSSADSAMPHSVAITTPALRQDDPSAITTPPASASSHDPLHHDDSSPLLQPVSLPSPQHRVTPSSVPTGPLVPEHVPVHVDGTTLRRSKIMRTRDDSDITSDRHNDSHSVEPNIDEPTATDIEEPEAFDLNAVLNNYPVSQVLRQDLLNDFNDDSAGSNDGESDESDCDSLLMDDTDHSHKPGRDSSTAMTPHQVLELALAISLLKKLRKRMKKGVLLGVLTIYGNSRYSLKAYRHLVLIMKGFMNLPSASAIRIRVFPYFLDHLTVRSTHALFPTKSGHAGSVRLLTSLGDRSTSSALDTTKAAVVVLPSDWARLDIRCLHTFRELVCNHTCRCHQPPGATDIRIESISRVTEGRKCAAKPLSLWVSKEGIPHQASVGTTVHLHTFQDQQLPPSVLSSTSLRLHAKRVQNESCQFLEATVLSTYVVGFESDRGMFFDRGNNPVSSTNSQQSRALIFLQRFLPNHDNANVGDTDTVEHNLRLRIGDHVSFMRASADSDNTTIVAFVNRFWPSRLDDDRQFILILIEIDVNHFSMFTLPSFGVPAYVQEALDTAAMVNSAQHQCRTTGLLQDGRRFCMYRLLLYADDFNARSPLFPRGSVGGVYMSPAGFSIRAKRSQHIIRTLSLTPSGVSTNHVLDHNIEDLINGCLNGFSCTDPFGDPITCFFEVMGFLGDYPASSAVVDVMGHTSLAPCTHCTFVLLRSSRFSRYAFTTIIHSCNTIYRRTQKRTTTMRAAGLDDNDARRFGMKDGNLTSLAEDGRYPLVKLAARYNSKLGTVQPQSPFNRDALDCYDLNIIAPDHLLTGLMKGVLFCTFRQMPSDNDCDNLQVLLKAALLEFGFQSQTYLFQNNKLVPGLSMSMLYAVFTVLPAALESQGLLRNVPTKALIRHLHTFACIGFWWPSPLIDGMYAWNFVHGSKGIAYHSALHKVACNFVKSVDRYVRRYPAFGKYVDRPNTHRLLELTVHALPNYLHLLFVCELAFESAHQPLKFLISRNTTVKSHINAVQVILLRDWMFRVWSLWRLYNYTKTSDTDRAAAMHGLMRLFCGHRFDEVDWQSQQVRETKDDIEVHVKSLLTGTVEELLNEWYCDSVISNGTKGGWCATKTIRPRDIPISHKAVMQFAVKDLQLVLNLGRSSPTYISRLSYQRGLTLSSTGSHDRIELGDMVQVIITRPTDSSRFLQLSNDGHGDLLFLVVGGIISFKSGKLWLVCRPCFHVELSTPPPQIPNYNASLLMPVLLPPFFGDIASCASLRYLRMQRNVRKVTYLHNCISDGGCKFSSETRTVQHSRTTLSGGNFYLVPRSYGYPARRS